MSEQVKIGLHHWCGQRPVKPFASGETLVPNLATESGHNWPFHWCFSSRVGCAFLSKADDRIANVCGVMLLAVPSMKPITFPLGAEIFFRATRTEGSVMKFSSSMRAPFVASNVALK